MAQVFVEERLLGDEGEAEVAEWYVEDGHSVKSGEPLVELESAKTTVEVEAPVGGVITLLVSEGDVVGPDEPIARID